ncbi:MAG TPA: carboxypeptidase-like regulatory domain-containing protein, partial [Candidatus Eisenbacteria bacterium]|nr:carboxypeptidase-like regulatory domain-containing protein [Candidatus Eisenbacteria bacterium]
TDASASRTFTAVSDGSGGYAIQLPPGTYVVIAGHADRSPYQRQVTVRPGDVITLNLAISPPTGLAAGWASGGGPAR